MRRSRVTGAAGLLILRDGATAVPTYERWTFEAQATYVRGDGRTMRTIVCCGPAAPAPYRYSESIERVRGETCYVIREGLPDGRVRMWARKYTEHEVEAVGIETLWRGVRAQYVRQIRGERA